MRFKTFISALTTINIIALLAAPGWAEPIGNAATVRNESVLSKPNKIDGNCKNDFESTNHKQKVIVALGGGGFKSVAQIGVLRSLEKNKIPIDGIVGTSMGALIGSLYCSGHSLDEIEALFLDGTLQKALNEHLFLKTVLRPLAHLTYVLRTRPYGGLTDAKKLSRLLQKELPSSFNDLQIPFAAVSTDLTDGRTTVLGNCKLPRAVMASMAVPALMRPVEIAGKLYVDGGLKANLPAHIARQMGATTVIAVLVDTPMKPVPNKSLRSIGTVVQRVMDIVLAASDKEQVKSSDILIYPNADDIPMLTCDKDLLRKGIAAGGTAADKLIPEIRKEIASNAIARREAKGEVQ